jgi:hypothetical protein
MHAIHRIRIDVCDNNKATKRAECKTSETMVAIQGLRGANDE